ncbi:MAG: hypothetical protein AAF849_19500 [Bacteroidota bacterium]
MKEIIEDIKDSIWSSERRLDLIQVAKKQGYAFKNSRAFISLDIDLKQFHFFGSNKKHKLKHILSESVATLGGKVEAIDFYRKGKQKKWTTIIVVESPLLELPAFRIEARTRWDWWRRKPKGRNIEFMGFPEFNDRYHLYTSASPRQMKDLLQEEALDFLLEQQNLYLEANKQFLLFGIEGQAIEAQDIPDWMHYGKTLGQVLLQEKLF